MKLIVTTYFMLVAGNAAANPAAFPAPLAGAEARQCGPDIGECEEGCCSFWGFCDIGPDYCGVGCQEGLGAEPCDSEQRQCGPDIGTCAEGCCSEYGFCDVGPAYCGAGCQEGFGAELCDSEAPEKPTKPTADPRECGPDIGTCAEGCCSEYGFCDVGPAYCGAGCQVGFGAEQCDSEKSPETPETPETPESPDTPETPETPAVDPNEPTCGPGIGSCLEGCCSQYGFCDTGPGFCDAGCQSGYGGICDSDPPGTLPFGFVLDKCTVPGTVAITFDDGPSEHTGELLDVIDEFIADGNDIKVTFFVVGRNVRGPNGANVKRAFDAGHQIASHSYTHTSFNDLSAHQVVREMVETNDAIEEKIGERAMFMRFPYGAFNEDNLKIVAALKFYSIGWNRDTKDYVTPNIDETIEFYDAFIDKQGAEESIVLQHDIVPETIDAMREAIQLVIDSGLKMVTVSECFGAESPYRTL